MPRFACTRALGPFLLKVHWPAKLWDERGRCQLEFVTKQDTRILHSDLNAPAAAKSLECWSRKVILGEHENSKHFDCPSSPDAEISKPEMGGLLLCVILALPHCWLIKVVSNLMTPLNFNRG
jgi:hypothetical protein